MRNFYAIEGTVNNLQSRKKFFCFLLQLVSSVDPMILKLTKCDSDIYTHFRDEFPDVKLDVINIDEMKSPAGKEVCLFCKISIFTIFFF